MAGDNGTGGFEIDGKLYALDTGVPDEDGGAQGEWSSGDVHVDHRVKDISKPTKETLASYLSRVTKAELGSSKTPNRYAVDGNYVERSISDEQGYPVPISPSSNSEQFDPALKTGRSNDETAIDFKRGKSSSTAIDGNDLLRTVDQANSPVPSYQSTVLSHNKWYSPSNPLDGTPKLKTNFQLGTSDGQQEVTLGRLANIGSILILRAAGELRSKDPGFDPNSASSELGAILPGVTQAGLTKVSTAILTAQDVLNNLTNAEAEIKDEPQTSFGSINSADDPFTGLNSFGMVTLSAALVAALQVLINTLSEVFRSGNSLKKTPTKDVIGRYSLGSYFYGRKPKDKTTLLGSINAVTQADFGTLLGLTPTNYPFIDCLQKGSNAFFGIDDSNGLGGAIATGLGRSVESPGFNVVVARSIIRSASQLIEKTKNVKGNPIEVVGQTLSLIDLLKGSKIIGAINVFTQLGDAILTIGTSNTDQNSNGNKISKVDALPDNSPAVKKSRLKNSLKLAWAGDRTNTMLLRPMNILALNQAGKNLGIFNHSMEGVTFDGLTKIKIVNQRISVEDVEAQEQLLDAEYVPFYFHDLRTNEIISFHAFLASLTEDFSANYENSEGYGRIDPVKIYKNTTRTLNFSFYVASTSPDDFNVMWIKINKLITLLYPQYTDGKLVTDGENYTFRQPFSQQIGASPMIRVRIGDLIKTNYSRFNLARLFGLGDPNMVLNGQTLVPSSKSPEEIEKFESRKKQVAFNSPNGLTFIPAQSEYEIFEDSIGNVPASIPNIGGPLGNAIASATNNSSPKSFIFVQDGDTFAIKAVKKLDDFTIIGEVILNEETNPQTLSASSTNKVGANSDNILENYLGARYKFPLSTLSLTKSTAKKMQTKLLSAESNGTFSNELEAFMSNDIEKGNAIAKSFKTTQGKGLAGFIQTMNIDWMEGGTWETTLDRKAPKVCKINVSFAPIHDISPGIDSSGYNRAPVYGVGSSGPDTDKVF